MRSHGILDFPDPSPNPGGPGGSFGWSGTGVNHDLDPSNPRYQAADKDCQALLPDGGQLPPISTKQLRRGGTDGCLYAKPRRTRFPGPRRY
jgi:hypothetical protein